MAASLTAKLRPSGAIRERVTSHGGHGVACGAVTEGRNRFPRAAQSPRAAQLPRAARSPRAGRFPHVDALRAIAALGVLGTHAAVFAGADYPGSTVGRYSQRLAAGVPIF